LPAPLRHGNCYKNQKNKYHRIYINQTMPLTHFRSVALAIFFLGGAASASATVVVSDFSSSADGWTLADNDADSTLTYEASGGNPGGFIQLVTLAKGPTTSFPPRPSSSATMTASSTAR
jgi:hypothetical protein